MPESSTLSPRAGVVETAPARDAFLSVGFETPTLTLVRVRDGIVRASRDGEPINAPSDRAMLRRLPVLDADVDGDPPRPRILCEDHIRVSLHLDGDSLGVVTGSDAVLRPVDSADASRETPGVYFDPGVLVERVAREGAMERVRYTGFLVEAEGYVEASELTSAYEPRDRDEHGPLTAELPRGATFLDAPGGRTVAALQRYPNTSQRHLARTMGPTDRGHRLVRYADEDVVIIGWVVEADVVDVSVQPGLRGYGGGFGSGGSSYRRPVDLPEGTHLLDDAGGRVIGRLEREGRFECLQRCDSDAPRIEVFTCVGRVQLWTTPPSGEATLSAGGAALEP